MTRRPIAIDDLYEIRMVADPNIAPDGGRVAYVVTTVDRETNGYRCALWMVDVTGGEPHQFTAGRSKDTSPRWSPDGLLLAFLSDRSGKNQVHVMHADGGEAWQLTDGPNAAGDIAWSADSRALVYTSKLELDSAPTSDTRVITVLKYKADGEGFLDGKRRHVFMVDAAEGSAARQITDGDWDCAQPALSPDGRYLACVSNRSEDRANNTLSDIWVTDIHNGATQRVTGEDGSYGLPVWSDDGRYLAYVGHANEEAFGPVTLDELLVWEHETGELRRLLGALDREPGNSIIADTKYATPNGAPHWDISGEQIFTLVSDQGSVHVYACGLDGEAEPVVTGDRDIQSFTRASDGTLAFAASTMALSAEVFVASDGGERKLTTTNAAFIDDVELGEVEEVRFESDPGCELHGWLLKPPRFNATAKYPAIVQVHGGPHGMYGTGFFHEMHVLAARGYVVLFTNPRGSTGYGQAVVAGSMGDWGGADYRDVMAGADYLCALDFVDANRLGITGGSYGGYMVNWAIGQTNRFKAAVTQRSTANRISAYGTSDLNWSYNDWEYQGSPYDNPEFYRERSPLTYVANVTTPLLILHSENDLRCPITQAEEYFVALKKHGRTVEFVRFPDESHNLSRTGQPKHRVERLERLCGWFDRWL